MTPRQLDHTGLTFGLLLWTIYGFALGSLPVLIFSALGLVLSSVILVLRVRRPARNPPATNATGTCRKKKIQAPLNASRVESQITVCPLSGSSITTWTAARRASGTVGHRARMISLPTTAHRPPIG